MYRLSGGGNAILETPRYSVAIAERGLRLRSWSRGDKCSPLPSCSVAPLLALSGRRERPLFRGVPVVTVRSSWCRRKLFLRAFMGDSRKQATRLLLCCVQSTESLSGKSAGEAPGSSETRQKAVAAKVVVELSGSIFADAIMGWGDSCPQPCLISGGTLSIEESERAGKDKRRGGQKTRRNLRHGIPKRHGNPLTYAKCYR